MKRFPIFCILLCFLLPCSLLASQSNDLVLTVQSRDTLIGICNTYLENPEQWPRVAQYNGLLDPDFILPGQKIVIPAEMLKGIPLAATVTYVHGTAHYLPPNRNAWTSLDLGQEVTQGGALRTGPDGRAEITFASGSTLTLTANTLLDVAASQEKGGFIFIEELFLKLGRTINRIRRFTGKETRHRISTPSAVAAVRGTEFKVDNDTGNTTRLSVLEGEVKLAAANRTVTLAQGQGSFVHAGQPPADPRPLLPPPIPEGLEALYRQLPVTIPLLLPGEASSFRYIVSTDPAGLRLTLQGTMPANQPLSISDLEDGSYFLTLWSIDSSGLEGFASKTFQFDIRVNPRAPSLISPAQGARIKGSTAALSWSESAGAASYEFQIEPSANFPQSTFLKRTAATRVEVKDVGHGTFFFRVRAVAPDGFTSPWSSATSFVLVPPPPPPVLGRPVVKDDSVRLHWQSLGKSTRYRLQVSEDPAFKSVLLDKVIDEPFHESLPPERSGTYFFRVGTLDEDGYAGPFSQPGSFRVKPHAGLAVGVLIGFGMAVLLAL